MSQNKSPLAGLYDWLDERTGIKAGVSAMLDEPIRGGARFAYVFGSILLTLFILQVVGGIVLSLYYVPSADHAHTSVSYIQKVVPGGALIRGIHHYGASAMVIVAVLHLAQAYLFGAYKNKRELLWGSGGLMLLIIFGFAFTGYLLAWDQAAYFGTKVGTSIAGEMPVVGSIQQKIILGGNDLTTITLSRFFTVHVFLLPLALAGLAGLHLFLFRRAGPAGPFHNRDDHKTERFYPGQMFRDTVAIAIVFSILVWLSGAMPAELGPVADPSSDYLARPPWYFLPLFQLLKYFPGQLSLIPTVLLPGALFGALFLLPFFDRNPERHPFRRPVAVGVLAVILLSAIGLMWLSKVQDHSDPEVAKKLLEQEEEQRGFFNAPFKPQEIGAAAVPAAAAKPGAGTTVAANVPAPPPAYVESCADCHGDKGQGTDDGPDLLGISAKEKRTKEDLGKILEDSRAYGLKKPMPKNFPDLSAEDKQKIVDWMLALKK
ncbi:MAG: cytochrome b N-terminal domain-containing protein [Blastocatellia bacterium]